MDDIQKSYHFMDIALREAKKHQGLTTPNPAVGCVIVKDGQIIAKSRTAIFGSPHAEKMAIDNLVRSGRKKDLQGAHLYSSLEPCCHYGKNPPCTDSIIKYGISKVFAATKDLDYRVYGKSKKILEDMGVEVHYGIYEEKAKLLYQAFFSKYIQKRPFITVKIATSLDGKIALANGKSKWITGEESRRYIHNLRLRHDAILTGINTILADDPLLNCRINGINKVSSKFVLDSNLRIGIGNKIVKYHSNDRLFIITTEEMKVKEANKYQKLKMRNIEIMFADREQKSKFIDIRQAVKIIADQGFDSILVEAGSSIVTSLIKSDLVDRIIWFHAPKIFGNDATSAIADLNMTEIESKFSLVNSKKIGQDIMSVYEKLYQVQSLKP